MKIALIQDSLLICAGSERVFKCLVETFPEADIFTLSYNSRTTCSFFKDYKINTSWINKLIQTHNIFKISFPISTYIMQMWNFKSYDIIISSSATTAKYISRFKGEHYCFGYYPTRAIWDYDKYFIKKSLLSKLFKFILPYLKKRDLNASKRVTCFISQSKVTQDAFNDIYGLKSPIINSPIEYEKFKKGTKEKTKNFYLIVSRLEEWKKLDYAIEAFNETGESLKIIGSGPLEKKLKLKSKQNIEFIGNVSDELLIKYYGRSKALIFTPALEYGLTPLESVASGTPVIAFGEGAINETMIPFVNNDDFCTAVFFNKQNKDSLINAISKFENILFNKKSLTEYAEKFSENNFKIKMRNYIINKNTI